jgi:hypothetical protein
VPHLPDQNHGLPSHCAVAVALLFAAFKHILTSHILCVVKLLSNMVFYIQVKVQQLASSGLLEAALQQLQTSTLSCSLVRLATLETTSWICHIATTKASTLCISAQPLHFLLACDSHDASVKSRQ